MVGGGNFFFFFFFFFFFLAERSRTEREGLVDQSGRRETWEDTVWHIQHKQI